jgi:hypothetical protein
MILNYQLIQQLMTGSESPVGRLPPAFAGMTRVKIGMMMVKNERGG